jgi:hypothetical protein
MFVLHLLLSELHLRQLALRQLLLFVSHPLLSELQLRQLAYPLGLQSHL